jgi:hypothetical protein
MLKEFFKSKRSWKKDLNFTRIIISGNVNDKLKFKIWLIKSIFGIWFVIKVVIKKII